MKVPAIPHTIQTFENTFSLSKGNSTLHLLEGALWERLQRDRCLKHEWKNDNSLDISRWKQMRDYRYKKGTCGTRHPLFLSSGYVYFWSVSKERCLLWNVIGSVLIRVSAFCPPSDTYDLCVMCLGEEHVRFVHEGTECVHCERFSLKKLRSHLSLFSRELGKSSAPCGSVPAVAEAARRLRSWGSQMEFADDIERGVYLSRSVAADEVWARTLETSYIII